MARAPRRIDPEIQLQSDMVELMGYAAFRRFLFTIMTRSGMAAASYGTEVATSYAEGRRSLGIDILRLADSALPVKSPDGLPFAAIGIAISEGLHSQPQEPDDNATQPSLDDSDLDPRDYERR